MQSDEQKKEKEKNTFISPDITLSNGINHPQIGYGTYKVGITTNQEEDQNKTTNVINDALSIGYRFFDCAEFYNNESKVGDALKHSARAIPREELFLCSKVWTTTIDKGPDAIRAQVNKSLEALKTDYLDLYLVHWPVPGKHVEAYLTLQELQKEGVVRGIGLSNYAVEDYLEIKSSLDFSIP